MDPSHPPEITRLDAALRAARAALEGAHDTGRRQARLDDLERLVPTDGPGRVYALSFLLAVLRAPHHLQALHGTLWSPEFSLQQRHFFYWQLITRYAGIECGPPLSPAMVYRSLLDECRTRLGYEGHWIPPADRDASKVVVITNQLLGPRHAPTADCLDYCVLLQKRLGKSVFLVNTADMPWTLPLPYFEPMRFNRIDDYSRLGRLGYKDTSIDFYQCRRPMPNLDEVKAILSSVASMRPSFVFSLGHSNLAADLCAEFVTVTTMPFGTNLARARSNLYVLPRQRRPSEDERFMHEWGIRDEQIVESEYTFALPPATPVPTRAELGLPEEAYVIAIVGNRLDEEITPAVAEDLARLLRVDTRVLMAFMGTFRTYSRLVARDPVFAAQSVFLGYRQDVPAVYERCNAYLNPPRYGGGSSAAFALAAGLPVLTQDTGDVANIAGSRFHFASFDDIVAFVRRAQIDTTWRREWHAAAKARFAAIADRETMLRDIVDAVAEKADIRLPERT